MNNFMEKIFSNVWRLLLIPSIVFFLAAIEVLSGKVIEGTIYMTLTCFGISIFSFSSYFICSVLHKICVVIENG